MPSHNTTSKNIYERLGPQPLCGDLTSDQLHQQPTLSLNSTDSIRQRPRRAGLPVHPLAKPRLPGGLRGGRCAGLRACHVALHCGACAALRRVPGYA